MMLSLFIRHATRSALLLTVFMSGVCGAQTWSTIAPVQKARSEASVIQYRGDMYVFNGFSKNIRIENSVEKFDLATRSWSVIGNTSTALGNAVTHNGIVRHGTDVWLIGGRIGSHPGAVSKSVWIFNLDNRTWRRGPDLPVAGAGGGAALVNNRIHWFGGFDSQAKCDVNRHLMLDLNLPSAGWQDITSVAAMPNPRNHFATAVHNNLIYAIGGQYGHDGCPGKFSQDVKLVHVFNPANNSWTRKADLPTVQSHIEPSTFAYGEKIYVVGGQTKGNKVLTYDPANNQWTTEFTMPVALLAPVARIVDGELIVASGGAPSTAMPITTVRSMKLTSLSPISLPTETLVTVEAEYFDDSTSTNTHQWLHQPLANASNNDSMVTSPNYGALSHSVANSPMLSYLVYFKQPGKYYLWVRGWGDSNSSGEGRDDSLHAGLNGSVAASADKIDRFPAGWHWSRHTRDNTPAHLNIPGAGIHAVNLWMREDGLAIDKFVLTTDPDYVPTGVGSNSTDGTTDDSTGGNTTGSTTTGGTTTGGTTTGGTTTGGSVSGGSDGDADFQTINGIVAVEVENHSNIVASKTHRWIKSAQSGASGNTAMTSDKNIGTIKRSAYDSPSLSFDIYFAQAGTYSVWLRGLGDTIGTEGKDDSVYVGLNGNYVGANVLERFPANWQWSRSKRGGGTVSVNVPAKGVHTVNLWMREDGLVLDKLVLSKIDNFVPVGHGPNQTNGAQSDNTDSTTSGDTTSGDTTSGDTTSNGSTPTTSTNNGQFRSVNGLVSIESENYSSRSGAGVHEWKSIDRNGGSGSASMMASPNSGKISYGTVQSPSMNYSVDFKQAGTYYVWVRGWGDTFKNEGKSDSVHVGLNGTLDTAKALQHFPATWHWSSSTRTGRAATLNVPTAGKHVVNVWMREDGLVVDKIVLSTDATFVPREAGPDETSSVGAADDTVDSTANDNTTGGKQTDNLTASTSSTWKMHTTTDGSKVVKRHEAGGVVFNDKLYLLGGRGTRAVSVFDPLTNKWTQKKAAPLELNHAQPVVWNNKIWLIGAFTGGYPDEIAVDHVYSYTPATDQWKKEHEIPASRRRGGAAAAVYEDNIYIVGGNTAGHRQGAKPWLDVYSPATGQWQSLTSAPTARDHISVAIANQRLVVAAGRQSSYPDTFGNMIARTEVYNLTTGNWSKGADIPTRRAGAMAVSVGNEVIVIGGETKGVELARNSVEAYNVVTNQWRKLKPLQIGRHGGAAAVLLSKIHVVSGSERRGGAPESTAHETLQLAP